MRVKCDAMKKLVVACLFLLSAAPVFGQTQSPLLRCLVTLSRSLAVYLYSASGSLFTEDVLLNRIAEKLRISFSDQMNRNVSPSELNAWRNSLQSFAHVLSHFQLTDVGVVLEIQLPLTSKRLDCLLTGVDETGQQV